MKLKLLVADDDGSNLGWKDMYIDENAIIGFSIPDVVEEEIYLGETVNVYTVGTSFTMKQEPHLIEYLTKFI